MAVQDLFHGSAFTPFGEDIGAAAAGPGPQPVVNRTLADLAEKIQLPANAQAAAPQARPNPLASATSFVSDVLRVNERLSTQALQGLPRAAVLAGLAQAEPEVYARYIEWTALSAVVALRGVYSMYGLQVEMQAVALDAGQNLFDRALLLALYNMNEHYRFQVTGRDENTGRPVSGQLFYLIQTGERVRNGQLTEVHEAFAIYSDEIGVCPMVDYAADLFAGRVPWYQANADDHKSWRDPLACGLGDYAENRFRWWMARNGCPGAVGLQAQDLGALNVYDACATLGGWNVAQAGLTALYANQYPAHLARSTAFCTVCGGYLDAAGVPQVLPLFFTPQLLLAHKADPAEPCGLGYNTADGWQPLALAGDDAAHAQLPGMDCLVPVLPFTREAAALLDTECQILSLTFTARAAGQNQLACVEMRATLRFTDLMQQELAFTRTYPVARIQGGVLPYLMVWPWVPLPEDAWNRFYATQKQSTAAFQQMYGESFDRKEILTLQLDRGEVHTVQERGHSAPWQVVCSESRFRYAMVLGREDKIRGMVCIPRVPALPAQQIPIWYHVSVDFGTTTTVCAIQDPQGNIRFLPYREYGRNVTIGLLKEDLGDLARQRWMGRASAHTGDTLLARKTLSTAQLFDRATADGPAHAGRQMFLDGRFFLATSTQLCGYTANGDFEHQGIYNDLKLSPQNDTNKSQASVLFLAGVYIQALLYVLSEGGGAGRIGTLRASYPGALTRNILVDRWRQAADLVNGCLPAGAQSPYALHADAIQYCTEARAVQYYGPAQQNCLNVDIGGGTTDLSVVLAGQDAGAGLPTLSFKYAGREIMINSLIQLYRRWQGGRDGAQKHFQALWGAPLDPQLQAAPDQGANIKNQLIDSFFDRCAALPGDQLAAATQDESLRTLLEILMNDFDMTLPADGAYNLLREVLSLKFFLLMRMVAVFLAENPAMQGPLTQNMYNERRQPVSSLCLSLTGTAAMTLQHVFNRPLDQLQGLQCVQAQTAPQQMLRALARMMARVMNQVQGRDQGEDWLALTLRLSADVRQKQEVAFGLLNGAQADGGAVAAAAEVTPDAVLDLLWALPEKERGDWYWDAFREPLEGTETEQRAQAAARLSRLGRADRERYSSDLVQQASTRQLEATLAQLKNDREPLCRQAEQIFADWNDFAYTGRNGVWIGNAPVDANVGLGAGVTHLGDVLPRGMDLYNIIGTCLGNIQNGAESRYLASIAQPGYRNALLTVYVVEQLINETLCGHQK